MADVRREKELAERRKNEPQLDQTQDHLVRKIFSKFRRDRSLHPPIIATSHGDVEKGDDPEKSSRLPMTKLSSVVEKDDGVTQGSLVTISTKSARPTTVKTSKWGRLLGSSSLDSSSECSSQVPAFTRSLSARDTSKDRPSSSSSSTTQQTAGSGNKVFPKLQKLQSHTSGAGITRQDTIEEIVEIDDRERAQRSMSLRKVDSYDGGLRADPMSLLYHSRPNAEVSNVMEYKELMNNVMDIKVDVKLEVQRLSQKIERMEEILTELVGKLTTSGSISQSPQGESDQEKSVRLRSYPTEKGAVLEGTGLGPIILKKRRAKSRTKGK